MNQLPTPDPVDRVDTPTLRRSPRRRLAVTVATAGLLGVGGLVAGSQIAGATAPVADGSVEAGEPVEADPEAEFEAQFEAYDSCMAEQLPGVFGGDAMSDVDTGEAMVEWEVPDNVAIHTGGTDGDFTILDLGEGDSVITITKTDGEVQVSTDGDVEEIDVAEQIESMTDAEWEAEFERFDAAHERCEDSLPDSVEFASAVEVLTEAGATDE